MSTDTVPTMPTERETPLDPAPEYTRFREESPIARVRFPNGMVGWLVTRFEEGSQVFSDPRLSANRPDHQSAEGFTPAEDEEAGEDVTGGLGPQNTFVLMDEPDHGAYRKLLAGRFTPKSINQKLQPYIDRVVDEHLDALEEKVRTDGSVDLIEHLALPIPCLVICELLGVPYRDRDGFHGATEKMMDTAASGADRTEGLQWLVRYITDLVASKRADPDSEGLLADLVRQSQQEGSVLSDSDLISIGVLLLFAGHDTTMAMIGLSILTLLRNPGQWNELREERTRIRPAVEELLRYLTIVQFGLGRVATEDLELAGAHIAEGDLVVVSMAAANRDPRVFSYPDALDLDREMTRHMAFGYGVHQCLGQNVARAELGTIIPRLIERFPDMRLAVPADEVPMDITGTNYGLKKLPVTW
ncbi:MAG: cytochrome P450 [Pseudonocardia sp.]|nr:cytochrome P450 [Pseudonocardia sp.]